MPSTRSRKGVNTLPTTSDRSTSATTANQKKKPRAPPSRKRPRRNSSTSDEGHSASETNITDPSPITTQPITTQLVDSSLANPLSQGRDDLPTLHNYSTEEMMKKWPPSRCKERLAMGFKGSTSKDGKDEIKALIRKYEHLKMMLALALKCSLRTVNKQVAVSSKKAPSAYLYFRIFGKSSHAASMPHPDDEDITQKLGDFNRATGDAWTELNSDQRAVFEHPMLLALAGIPDLAADHVDSDDDNQDDGDVDVIIPEVTQLTEDEEIRYRPIYEQLVNHDKVVSRFGASVPGISDSKFTRRSLRCIQKHQRDLLADSHRHEFDFWLVASSSVPPLQPGTLTWCKVTTTLPIMTKWVTQKSNFPLIFGAVSQGTSLIQAVQQTTGSQVTKAPARKNKSDCEKVSLGKQLIELLTKTMGERPNGLPRGPNIDKTLAARKHKPVRIVQLEGSTLTAEDLAKGFVEMNAAGRRRWKQDLDLNLFHFELITMDGSGGEEDDMNAQVSGGNAEERACKNTHLGGEDAQKNGENNSGVGEGETDSELGENDQGRAEGA
ncbi:hypothetical protein DFH28DRAFT_196897 [Melampsora americana]|nr:hypothetical protein DFH28DRAFT_196897 [Melampsora americana]